MALVPERVVKPEAPTGLFSFYSPSGIALGEFRPDVSPHETRFEQRHQSHKNLLAGFLDGILSETERPLLRLVHQEKTGLALAFRSLPAAQQERLTEALGKPNLSQIFSLSDDRSPESFYRAVLQLTRQLGREGRAKLGFDLLDASFRSLEKNPAVRHQLSQDLLFQFQDEAAFLQGGGSTVRKVRGFIDEFSHQWKDPISLIGFGVAVGTFNCVRFAALSGLLPARAGVSLLGVYGAETAAFSLGLGAESTALALSTMGLRHLSGEAQDFSYQSVKEHVYRNGITLGLLRTGGLLARGGLQWFHGVDPLRPQLAATRFAEYAGVTKVLVPQVAMFGAIAAAAKWEAIEGLRPDADLFTLLGSSFATLLHFNTAAYLFNKLQPERFRRWTESLETRSRLLRRAGWLEAQAAFQQWQTNVSAPFGIGRIWANGTTGSRFGSGASGPAHDGIYKVARFDSEPAGPLDGAGEGASSRPSGSHPVANSGGAEALRRPSHPNSVVRVVVASSSSVPPPPGTPTDTIRLPRGIVSTLDAVPIPMLLVDPQQTVLYRNTAMLQQLIPLLDPMRAGSQNPTTLGELMGLFTSLNLVERTYELNTENSDPQRFRITREVLADYPGFDVVSFQNVTAELQARSAQKVLRQQHDFNNIASVLVANYGIINEAVAPMIDPLRNLGEVRRGDSVESLEKLAGAYDDMQIGMRRLVDFCRESTQLRLSSPNVAPSIVYQVYEVGKILQEALRWQEPIRKRYGHEVEISIEPDLRIAGQDFPILNAAINLIKNAYEAMSPGGRLSVKAWRESTNAVLEVTDTGPGIPPEVQPRIFEPFFTTKGKTGGSGFGLANALEGVRAQGGMIEFETRLGVGTTFRVTLPILQKD